MRTDLGMLKIDISAKILLYKKEKSSICKPLSKNKDENKY